MNYTKSHTVAREVNDLMFCNGYTEVEARQIVLLSDLMYAQAKRKCAKIGHRIVDSSTGGPESGCIDIHCARCGYHYNVTLY
jgi:hypothetical protein